MCTWTICENPQQHPPAQFELWTTKLCISHSVFLHVLFNPIFSAHCRVYTCVRLLLTFSFYFKGTTQTSIRCLRSVTRTWMPTWPNNHGCTWMSSTPWALSVRFTPMWANTPRRYGTSLKFFRLNKIQTIHECFVEGVVLEYCVFTSLSHRQIVCALEQDDAARKQRLAFKLEQVVAFMSLESWGPHFPGRTGKDPIRNRAVPERRPVPVFSSCDFLPTPFKEIFFDLSSASSFPRTLVSSSTAA